MRFIPKYLAYFSFLMLIQGCGGIEAFLQQKLFNFNDDIAEIKGQITIGEHIQINKTDFYVLKMAEKGEIEISIGNKKSYADLPYKKYIPICTPDDNSTFITEETYLYLHEFDMKTTAIQSTLEKPIAQAGELIFEILDTLFVHDMTGALEASGVVKTGLNNFYNEHMLTLGKVKSGVFPRDSVLKKYRNILAIMTSRIADLKDRQLSLQMRAGFKRLKTQPVTIAGIDFIEQRIDEANAKLNKMEASELKETFGIAAYFVTYPYTDSVNMTNLFNKHLNGNHLVLNAIRHLRIGFWSKRGKEVTLYFKHKNKFVGFQGHHGHEGAFMITKGSHPSMGKHFSSKTLHFVDISEVLDLGGLDGLPFFNIDPKRRMTRFFEDFEELLTLEERRREDLESTIRRDTSFQSQTNEAEGTTTIDTIINSSSTGAKLAIDLEYPNITGFRFGEKVVRGKEVPQLYFSDAGPNWMKTVDQNGNKAFKYFRYDGMLSILDKKEFEAIKAANPN